MVALVKPSKRGYFDHKQGAFGVMVWTEAGIPEVPDPLVSLIYHEGLSPRGRGNLLSGTFQLFIPRSIPAWAGEPCPMA